MQKLERLEDEPDLFTTHPGQRGIVKNRDVSTPSISTDPEVGKCIAPHRLSIVDLPHSVFADKRHKLAWISRKPDIIDCFSLSLRSVLIGLPDISKLH